ncbi:MAG: HAD-IIA family hydrolase [Candidatus Lokiarchaeota archaeon]|nr:HAD-IIA family hydrolase [Candidatus Lokiarchaeota archaeon]
MLWNKKIFFLDRDGTLAIGMKPIPGVNEFLEALSSAGKSFYVLTNNSSKTPVQHHERLAKLGLNLKLENVLVSIQAAMSFLRGNGYQKVYWIANKPVEQYILEHGFTFEKRDPDCILLTYDTELTYEKLVRLTALVRQGVSYFTTHEDIVCPTESGPVPDVGTFIKAIEMTTGVRPSKSFGKPNPAFIEPILAKHGYAAKDAVIVGDRLYTDIKMAIDTGITSVLVLTGESKREDHEASGYKASLVVDSVVDLIPLLGK